MSTEQAILPDRNGRHGVISSIGSGTTPGRQAATSFGTVCLIGLILLFVVLPTLIVVGISVGTASYIEFPPTGMSLRWYHAYFTDPAWMAATFFSIKIALATTAAATLTGTLAAIALVRGDLPGKSIFQAVALGPLIIPHVVFGIALYLVFAPLRLTGNFLGFLIAHTVLAVPYVVISVMAALQRFDSSLELAAMSCGANRIQSFCHVMLPNILPGISSGAVFAFLSSFDEATVAFFLSDIGGKTISSKMFEDIDFNLTPVIAAISTVLVAVSFLLMSLIYQTKRR